MRAQIWGSIAALTLVSCQTPPGGYETSFRVCVTLSEWSSQFNSWDTVDRGDPECVTRPSPSAGATIAWSDWAFDSNGYDPDGVKFDAEKASGGVPSTPKYPRAPDSRISQDVDFRLLIQLDDEGDEGGAVQATPWASEGGGWSPYALDANGYDFDRARVGIETRPAPGLMVWDMRIGVRAADGAGSIEGVPQYSPWLLGAYGSSSSKPAVSTGYGADPDKYDPDAVAIYLEPMLAAPLESASGFRVCAQVVDHLPETEHDYGAMECSPFAMSSPGIVWSNWAYDSDQLDPDGVGLHLHKYYTSAAFVLRDLDVRLLIQLTDAGEGPGEIQATPWASEGAGWSSYALDPNAYDFDGVRVGIETKATPGLNIDTIRIGIRLADQGGAEEGTPQTLLPGFTGWTGYATDPNEYDPDAVAIYLETTTSTVP